MIVKVGADIADVRRNMPAASKVFGQEFDRIERQSSKTAAALMKTGATVTAGLTLPIIGMGAASIKAATDFNEGMANVATLIPGNAKRIDDLKDAVQGMAIATGQSTKDLTGGLYQVISAFGDTADTAKILDTNARAAAAGMATTEQAIALTSAVTKGYGDTSAEAVAKASDLALLTVRLGQTTFPELAGAIGKVVPLSKQLGVSQEELFAVMATATGVTGNAAEVATQYRGILQSLFAPTTDMQGALKKMGFESGDAAIKGVGLKGALDGVLKVQQASGQPLQKFISSIEGQTLALQLSGASSKDYNAKLGEMGKAQGAAVQAFKDQTEGVNAAGFAYKQFEQKIAVTAQRLGDALIPLVLKAWTALEPFVDAAIELVNWFSKAPAPIQNTVIAIAALAAAIGPMILACGLAMKAWATLTAAKVAAAKASAVLAGANGLPALAGALGVAAKGAGLLGAAFAGWKVGEWISKLKLFENASMDIGQSFEFGATKLLNWARGIKASDADIESAITSRGKLTAATDSNAGATDNASAALAKQQAELDKLLGGLNNTTTATDKAAASLRGNFVKAARDLEIQLKNAYDAHVPVTIILDEFKGQIEDITNKAPLWGAAISKATLRASGDLKAAALHKEIKKLNDSIVTGIDDIANALPKVEDYSGRALDTVKKNEDAIARATKDRVAIVRSMEQDSLALRLAGIQEHFEEQRKAVDRSVPNWRNALKAIDSAQAAAASKATAEWNKHLADIRQALPPTYGQIFRAMADQAIGAFAKGGWGGLKNFAAQTALDFAEGMVEAIPVVGPILKDFVAPIAKILGGLFGTAGRDAVKDFAASFGGFDNLHAKLGALGAEGERLWIALTQGVGRNNAAEAQKVIEQITKALDGQAAAVEAVTKKLNDQFGGLLGNLATLGGRLPAALEPYLAKLREAGTLTDENADKLAALMGEGVVDWKKLEEVAGRYGIKLEALGPAFQSAKLSAGAQQLYDDYRMLIDAGADVGAVLDGMSAGISKLVQDSIKFGVDIPENFKPLIDNLAASGKLLDANGKAITDTSKLKYGESIQTSIEKLIDKIKDLIDKLLEVPDAVKAIPRAVVVDVEYRGRRTGESGPEGAEPGDEAPEPPAFALGTSAARLISRPTLAWVGENHRPEAIVPLEPGAGLSIAARGESSSGQAAPAGGPTTIIIQLDGREIARSTVKHLPRVLKLNGVG